MAMKYNTGQVIFTPRGIKRILEEEDPDFSYKIKENPRKPKLYVGWRLVIKVDRNTIIFRGLPSTRKKVIEKLEDHVKNHFYQTPTKKEELTLNP